MGGKLKAGGLLFLMFGLGIASGITWEVYRAHHASPRPMFGERRIARLKKELSLTPWQEQTLREIVQDARDRANDVHDAVDYDLAQIHADSVDAIHQLLTPEQQERFEALRARMRARHHPKESADSPGSEEKGPEAKTS